MADNPTSFNRLPDRAGLPCMLLSLLTGLVFAGWFVLFESRPEFREPEVLNGPAASVGLISGFTALLLALAALALRRRLVPVVLSGAWVASAALALVEVREFKAVFGQMKEAAVREGQARLQAQAWPKFDAAVHAYDAADYGKCCDDFEAGLKIANQGPYEAGWKYIAACVFLGRGEAAGRAAADFLNEFGWHSAAPHSRGDWSPWVVLFGSAGYFQAGDKEAAGRLLAAGAEKCDSKQRLYPVIACLHGDTGPEALLASLGRNDLTLTEAKAFLGVRELYAGDRIKGLGWLMAVALRNNRNLEVYPLAMIELRRTLVAGSGDGELGAVPNEADARQARAGYERVELFWKDSEYEKLCSEFEHALQLWPVPGHDAICDYVAAATYLRRGEVSGHFARLFLEAYGWNNPNSPYCVLYGYIGYRQAGDPAAARALLDDAAVNCDPRAWPYPVIAALRGDLSESEVDAQVIHDVGRRTEAETVFGIQALYAGHRAEALARLEWVQKNGRPDNPAVILAKLELAYSGGIVPSIPPVQPPRQMPQTPRPPVGNMPGQYQEFVGEVVRLSNSGISLDLVASYVRTHRPVSPLTPGELEYLRANRVPAPVIEALRRPAKP